MTQKPLDTFTVSCPCCHAKLTVDRAIGVELSPVLPRKAHGGSRDWRGAVARCAAEAATLGGPGRHSGAAAATGGRCGSEVPCVGGSGEIEGRRAGAKIRRGFEEGERRTHRKTSARFRPRLNPDATAPHFRRASCVWADSS